MSDRISVREAKNRFSQLMRRIEAGEEIVIARRGKPVAKLVPVELQPPTERRPGRLKGLIALDDAFWGPLPAEEEEAKGEPGRAEPGPRQAS